MTQGHDSDDLILALDFGGTKHTAARARNGARTFERLERAPAPANSDAAQDLATMRELVSRVLGDATPAAVGVSFGGPVDYETGVVRLSHHVPGWENMPLRAHLRAEYGAPTAVDNDANLGAWGEFHFGAGQGCRSLLYLTVSTGVGGGWVLERRLWHGADSMAGEIGHVVVDPNGPICLCGKRGCVERFASGPYIALRAREWLTAQPERESSLRVMANGRLETITGQMVSAAAAQGDELAWEALRVSAWALGVGIGNAINLVNPERVVLGGGVTKSGERYWRVLREYARATALPQMQVEIVPAALGDDAPLWGAVALAQASRDSLGAGA